jgi:hypothetical protein
MGTLGTSHLSKRVLALKISLDYITSLSGGGGERQREGERQTKEGEGGGGERV